MLTLMNVTQFFKTEVVYMSEKYQYDVLYLGSGHGAFDGAIPLAASGKRVGLIEEDKVGGTCPNRGCNAKITLDNPVQLLRHQERMNGIVNGDLSIDWTKSVEHEHEVIDGLPDMISGLLTSSNAEIITGRGKFIDEHTIEVNGKNYTSDKIVISTGQRPHRLDVPGKELAHDSTDFMNLTKLPQKIVIIGGGYISMEFATIANAVGSDVTVLLHHKKALRKFNQEYVRQILDDLDDRGVNFIDNAEVNSFEKDGDHFKVSYNGEESLTTDWILDATGRIPNVENIGLDTIGVEYNDNGIEVNEHLQTSVDNIYASGDVLDKIEPKLTPTAIFESTYLTQLFTGQTEKAINYPAIPTVVFTSPQIAEVGITPNDAAKDDQYTVKTNHLPDAWFRQVDKELLGDNTLIYNYKGELVGASEISDQAVDAINVLLPAIEFKFTAEQLGRIVHLFPSLASDTWSQI